MFGFITVNDPGVTIRVRIDKAVPDVFTIQDEIRGMTAGDVCLFPQGKRFDYINSGSDSAKLILVHTPSFDLDSEVFE